MTTPPYEPEEYPRCTRCGRLAMHSRASLCCVCLVNETMGETQPKKSAFTGFTASDFTPAPPDKK